MSVSAGFFGKIPSRGDFVRHGLPQDFVAALDGWWQQVLAGSRVRLGEGWVDAWMQAPIWRFTLAPGVCGAGAVTGVWLPSTDKAGRLFPITFALVGLHWRDVARSQPFLAAAEAVGLRGLEDDLSPEDLAAPLAAATAGGGDPLEQPKPGAGIWWTEGSPLVAPASRPITGMPDFRVFATMLRDDAIDGGRPGT